MRLSVVFLCCVTGTAGAQAQLSSVTWGFGVAAGQMRFADASKESALGVTISARAWDWLDVSVNPTYAWAQGAPTQSGTALPQPGRSVSGLTDLPVTIGLSHLMPGPWSPSLGLSLGMTLPTGDTTTVGSGVTALGANLNLGFSPAENFSFGFGAGRSLSDGYSAGLASASPTSLALSTMFTAGAVSLGISLAGDVGAVPSGSERGRSIAGGVAIPVGGRMSLNFDGSSGLGSGAHSWAYTAGIGTTASGIVAATVAPYQRLRQAFGMGRKRTMKAKTNTK